jgi:transposase
MGFTIDVIANEFKINKNTVMLWLERYIKTGTIKRKKKRT